MNIERIPFDTKVHQFLNGVVYDALNDVAQDLQQSHANVELNIYPESAIVEIMDVRKRSSMKFRYAISINDGEMWRLSEDVYADGVLSEPETHKLGGRYDEITKEEIIADFHATYQWNTAL